MSEYINTSESRIKDLLSFSMGIMNGEDGRILIERYRNAIDNITPYDMIAMEDKQIRMGITPKIIKKDVDKVINVFYNSLSKYKWKKPEKDTFLFHLMLENEAFTFKLDQITKIIRSYNGREVEDLERLREELLPGFRELLELDHHYVKKENILFPYLEKRWENHRPLKVMWSLHDDIRKERKKIVSMLENDETKWPSLMKEIGDFFFLAHGMVQKEELIVFPIATESISDNEWLEMYNQSFEYPFPFIETPVKVEKVLQTEDKRAEGDELHGFRTETGHLNFEQISLAFDNLPVDITFVDENDKVRFFNRAKDRFFPRSPAIVGRDLRNCHPPESVHIVEKIVEEFKRGNRDKAEFRIKMKGEFILIRYFALRDGNSNYKGVLEVSQDITDISEMKDEKRLLDWS